MNDTITGDYKSFIGNNRIKINHYLNKVMWFFIITGPALALGIRSGIFDEVSYITCIHISLFVLALSLIHMILLKRMPDSVATSIFALTALDLVIVYMAYSHIGIYLTWFLIPLLSLLFCDWFIYFYAVTLNYILMFATTWMTAPYNAMFRTDHSGTVSYFAETIGGFTIETLIMVASGYIILKLTTDYYAELFSRNTIIIDQQNSMKEKMEILDSMAEIYDNVNLIDFTDNTEMSLRDPDQIKHVIDTPTQTHTLMNQKIMKRVMPDQLEEFLKFTNITTVRSRLTHKKLISADFIDIVSGWFRAQYITVDASADGVPNVVIYTIRNVDDEKRREEHLIRISMTDEMTRIFNRRCYEEDLIEYRRNPMSDDFVLFSVDVNDLKMTNDTKGHAAGDEIIKGAADCLTLSVGNNGKAYRIGGDEFIAVVHTDDPEDLRKRIHETAAEWHGIYSSQITVAVGFAAHKDHPDADIDKLERIADSEMYAEKEMYYKEHGIDRRH